MRILLLVAMALVSGCANELAGHTANIGAALRTVERRQMFKNVAVSFENPSFVPIPYTVGKGTATLNDDLSTGVEPSISFIGRAISGLKLDGGITFQRTFDISPEPGISARLRTRALYQYAICERQALRSCSFQKLRNEFVRLGSVGPRGQPSSVSDGLTEAITLLAGPLPAGPLVQWGESCAGNQTREPVDGMIFCFLDHATEAQFTMWLAAVTQGIELPEPNTTRETNPPSPTNQRGGVLNQRVPFLRNFGVEPLINRVR